MRSYLSSGIARNQATERAQLLRRATEGQLELAGVHVVAVERVFTIDADAAVQMLRRPHDPRAALCCGPE